MEGITESIKNFGLQKINSALKAGFLDLTQNEFINSFIAKIIEIKDLLVQYLSNLSITHLNLEFDIFYIPIILIIISNLYSFVSLEKRRWKGEADGVARTLSINISVFLLNVFVTLYALILVFSILKRLRILIFEWPPNYIYVWTLLYALTLIFIVVAIENASKIMIKRGERKRLSLLLASLSILFAIVSVLIWEGIISIQIGGLILYPSDAYGILNVSAILNILMVLVHNEFPNVYRYFTEIEFRKKRYYHGGWGIWLFIIILLTLILSILIIVQLEVYAGILKLPFSYFLTIASLIFASIILILLYLAWPRREEGILKRRLDYIEVEKVFVYSTSAILSIAFAFTSVMIIIGNIGEIEFYDVTLDHIDFAVFASLSATGPVSFYLAYQNKKLFAIEELFAKFLIDLAESRRVGMPLGQAIKRASGGDYGLLTPYIVKMSYQMSAGLTFIEALEKFAASIKSKIIKRGVALIIEAFRSGGSISEALEVSAMHITEMKYLEKERRSNMTVYLLVIYVAFFVFFLQMLYSTSYFYHLYLKLLP